MYKTIIYIVCLSVCLIAAKCDTTEGSSCEWDNVKGTCVEPRRCLSTTELRKEKEHPVCGQKDDVALICCTDCELVNDTSNAVVNPAGGLLWKDGRKFRDHCLQYLKDVPNVCAQQGYYGSVSKQYNKEKKCHATSLWGVGGAPPPGAEHPRENPYEALMGFGADLDSAKWVTSGAIISEKFILTSATGHTTTGGKMPLKFAALGVHNRSSDKKDWQIQTIKQIHHHPLFDEKNYHNLALLELDSKITFNKDVLPACLPDPETVIDTKTAKYSNWKDADMKFEDFTDVAEILTVEELTPQSCVAKLTAQAYSALAFHHFLPQGINDTTQLCYEKIGRRLNMFGAPVTVTSYLSRCMNTVIGILTWGDVDGPAGAFTRVSYYVPWIQSVVWPEEQD